MSSMLGTVDSRSRSAVAPAKLNHLISESTTDGSSLQTVVNILYSQVCYRRQRSIRWEYALHADHCNLGSGFLTICLLNSPSPLFHIGQNCQSQRLGLVIKIYISLVLIHDICKRNYLFYRKHFLVINSLCNR